jgi:gluconokinase
VLAADVPAGPERDEEVLALARGIPPGSDGLVMLPYLLAERGPLWDADVRGAFLGLRQHHSRGHLVRAAVEGVAFQLATILDGLDEVRPVTLIRATGGALRAPLWREVLAGVLGRPLQVTTGAEGSALGAAALGLHAIGVAATLEGALEALSPGLVDGDPAGASTVETTRADRQAYLDARASAAQRLRELRAAADLLAPRSRRATVRSGGIPVAAGARPATSGN